MEPRKKVSSYQRNARSRPDTKAALQFVNVVPTGQDECPETRAIIRANAAHFHWRHNRPPQEKPKPKQSRHGARRHTDRLKRGLIATEPSSCEPISLWNSGDVATGGIDQLPSSNSHVEENGTVRDYERNHALSPRISLSTENTYLGVKVDPFSSFPSELPPDFVGRCISYSKHLFLRLP
jgi:hypothetical protein